MKAKAKTVAVKKVSSPKDRRFTKNKEWFEAGIDIIGRMRKHQAKGLKGLGSQGERHLVAGMGECGRTASLYVWTGNGHLAIEEKGDCRSVTLAESVEWFRHQFKTRWFQDCEVLNDAFWLWMGMIEGCLTEYINGKAKR